MTGLVATLGVSGLALALLWAIFTAYWATRPFRPGATWHTDLAHLRHWAETHRRPRQPRPLLMGHDWWPRADVGPRMWRWPLNTTRWFCARLWALIAHPRPGLLGLFTLIARLAWYPASALGALAAIAQALVLMTLITLPTRLLLEVIDTITVLRGGVPPSLARRSNGPLHLANPPPNTDPGGDWDEALADLLETESPTEHGIRLGPDGQALDPAEQHALDRRRHREDGRKADARLDRIERILDREERLADRSDDHHQDQP